MGYELTSLFDKAFSFWSELSESDKQQLLSSSQNISLNKGKNIHDGNECTGIIMIKTGCLRAYMLSDDGKEITLYRLFPGDICVFSASCVLKTVTFDVLIDAEELSECVVIGGCAFEELASRVPEVKIFALEAALSGFSEIMWVMQQILFMSMDKRLAVFLLDEISKNGTDTVKLTHEQIAKYMGSAREVVSRMLKYFVTEGIVSVTRADGIKVLDKAKLRSIISRK